MGTAAGIGDEKMKPLFIFEMANNHQGSVEHGKRIICELKKACLGFKGEFEFAVKFQFRELDTFIHPNYMERQDNKNVKRFLDTRLNPEQFRQLVKTAEENGFKVICTPFDEGSVDQIVNMGFDFIKIASCSAGDWPLMEKIACAGLPVILSAAGSSLENVRRMTAFFEHRKIDLSLMHCIAEYPTADEKLQLNQIDLYKKEFLNHRIGFSTHEDPDNYEPIKLAIAKGASIFEKHVGVETDTITLNGYSANPRQVKKWLEAAHLAYTMCGVADKRYEPDEKERADLAALQRGVFAKGKMMEEAEINSESIFLAFPCQEGQLLANHLSKYNKIKLKDSCVVQESAPIMLADVVIENQADFLKKILAKIMKLLEIGNVVVPPESICEISHHYGIGCFEETGVAMIECINREYCKKILVVLPGQIHPPHYHVKKEETFLVLHGELKIICDRTEEVIHKGETKTVERNVLHSFSSDTGCVFEEISSKHYVDDSFYEEQERFVTPRKTEVYLTQSLLDRKLSCEA